MARYPSLSAAGDQVPASIFARLREHLARFPGDVIPLQIGDTHLGPPVTLDAVSWHEPADLYAYGAPGGWQPLIDALAARHHAHVQIAVGATHALSCAVQAVCDPGDELILLSPHWPLIRGIALGHRVVPVEVELAALEAAITPRTAAIYLASPNNPDGAMLAHGELAAIAELAERRGLWILSDEVYEHYVYDAAHVAMLSIARARPRTITVHSFAKSFAQAGLRVGYAITAEPRLTDTLRKLVNHSVYNVPVAMQRAALAALAAGDAFLPAAVARYRGARDRARERLTAPAARPPGGAYLWVDFRRWSGDDCLPVLERVAASGVLLAPGSAFGDAYGGFARLCFTGVDEARLDEGIDRINAVLAAWP
ncbi:MAG TPA: pyridoxal phosphate-dependent aminotransferase [Kofleriaceae bacterium]|nr:pyridoxal phosphate-dependent aminotransferase [Kofleriaceae bacterium]